MVHLKQPYAGLQEFKDSRNQVNGYYLDGSGADPIKDMYIHTLTLLIRSDPNTDTQTA